MQLKYLLLVVTILFLSQCLRAEKKCAAGYSISGKINDKDNSLNEPKDDVDCKEKKCVTMKGDFMADQKNNIKAEIRGCIAESECKQKKEEISFDKAYKYLKSKYEHGSNMDDFKKVLTENEKNRMTNETYDKLKGKYTFECCDADLCNKQQESGGGGIGPESDGPSSGDKNSAESGVTKYSIMSVVSTIFLGSFLMIR
uniref:Rifin PIR protein,putative n=1 Tax=Strongyloides papillosus TaxID=174720 RepID=A0A0N5B5L3_STREA